MMRSLCLLLAQTTWLQDIFSARALGIVLWVGLGILTISLLFLMRTRWGQAKPLSKCVALSIFAHLLLAGYAWGTRLIFEPPPVADKEVIKLTILDAGDQIPRQAENEPQEPQPWEQLVTESPIEPDLTEPERIEPKPEFLPQPSVVANVPKLDGNLRADSIPLPDPVRPIARATQSRVRSVSKPTADVAQIEKPKAKRRDVDDPIKPTVAEPSRAKIDAPDPTVKKKSSDNKLPSDVFNDQSRLQRLADAALNPRANNALADQQDRTAQAINTSDDKRQTVAPPQAIAKAIDGKSTEPNKKSTSPGDKPPETRDSGSGPNSSKETVRTKPQPKRVADGQQLPDIYRNRVETDLEVIAAKNGGSSHTEAAVKRALKWLAEHQSQDGRWDASRHGAGTETNALGQNRQAAGANADTGITGLALLAFLSRGYTHYEGEYQKTVQRGLEFLIRSQKTDGNLGGDARVFATMYCHGMASLAISEAYALTGDHRLKPYVERAVAFTSNSQHDSGGGWRYRPGDQGDMSQFGWQVMALKSAELGGIKIPAKTRDGMLRFLKSVSAGQHGGLARYRAGEQVSRTMTAEALTCRYFLGQNDQLAAAKEGTAFIAQELPRDGQANLYNWYYGTMALYQARNEHWPLWNAAIKRQLISRQRNDGDLTGSWDPNTVWGGYGGRVYTTAMATLCLEVYYRYLPLLSNQGAAK